MTDRADESPAEWAAKMPDEELLERMRGYCDAALPRAVADELINRYLGVAGDVLNEEQERDNAMLVDVIAEKTMDRYVAMRPHRHEDAIRFSGEMEAACEKLFELVARVKGGEPR